MPFVKNDRRAALLTGDLKPEAVGDECFLAYFPLVFDWRQERRWTTAHNQCKETFAKVFKQEFDDKQIAAFLAYLEHYMRNVHVYETEKADEFGYI